MNKCNGNFFCILLFVVQILHFVCAMDDIIVVMIIIILNCVVCVCLFITSSLV